MASGKKSYEIKIGIMALVSIIALFLGFNFFKGKSLFGNDKDYYTVFENVEGLGSSSRIMLNGYKVGKVSSIEMTDDMRFRVNFIIDKGFMLPKGSSLTQVGADLLSGGKNLSLIPSDAKEEAEEGSLIPGVVASGLMDGISKNVPAVMDNINKIATNADTLMYNLKGVVNDNTGKHIEQILASIELAMKQIGVLSQSLAQESKNISALMSNANGTVANLNKLSTGLNDGKIDRILNNAEGATNQLSQAKIQETIDNLEATSKRLDGLMYKLEQKDGSLGLLVNDPQLYQNLSHTVAEIGKLSEDLKAHPAKYINISIFPSKKR
jgi:phospholipid/cholesterol/gamma-HCH transport system substrate-binding protein